MELNSKTFFAIANLLRHIEALNTPSTEYGILDGGQTLETSQALYEQIKETKEFKAFQEVGGSQYSYDDDSFFVESGVTGVTAHAIANIFEG